MTLDEPIQEQGPVNEEEMTRASSEGFDHSDIDGGRSDRIYEEQNE